MVRKVFLINSVAGGAAVWAGLPARAMGEESAPPVDLPLENGRRRLVAYPQKLPLLVLTSRPVQLETPFSVFDEGAFTPNDAFFVRWHLADMPTAIDEDTFTIRVRGNVERELSLSVGDLRRLAPVEIAAVCECAGNSRGFWALDPCQANGTSCLTGDQCCTGYCGPGEGGLVCGTQPPGCAVLGNKCTMTSDCCGASTEQSGRASMRS